ncbi:2-oxo-4-hydroxy-4-carboxy-5-ureidoimidazoline decarboxylase [Sporolactobacillus sp. THM7-7]|nr:2-oxo-4-hydroxy-4-carboxy-5-ureidoimidazoline decarboxylase [Sporolactobacillus sp. THM7-7]
MNLKVLNQADPETFTEVLEGVFEHSPWIAREVAKQRPFASIDELFAAMKSVVRTASLEQQKALIEAHPRLGSKKKLTAESEREQEGAGLRHLGSDEAKSFTEWNLAYEERFGFPFIIAVRGLSKRDIEAAIKKRLGRSKEEEFAAALEEICKIARSRLEDKFHEKKKPILTGELTTHILDLTHGRPAANVRIDVFEVNGTALELLRSDKTNKDGRIDQPLLDAEAFHPGTYELHFHIGDYFRRKGVPQNKRPFLDTVVVRFGVADASEHYHVPLLVSPWGYQVYRGS